jgi:hypothetical protein
MKKNITRLRAAALAILGTALLLLTMVVQATPALASNVTPPLTVLVQPSGDTFANAYVLTGEARTYFGRVEGGTAPYQYRWEFSDGTDSGLNTVADPRYISYDGMTFITSGPNWARLTVTDSSAPALSYSATISLQVIVAGSDNLLRQKNSAVDRGLRLEYQNESVSGTGSSWPGSGGSIAATSMALIAMENHGHNLQSPDTDIFKKSVKEGIKFLLNNATMPAISSQPCIGDPQEGDLVKDGLGVQFGDTYMYANGLAVLALVNSCDKATAQATAAVTSSGDVNGRTLYDIALHAKDFIAWAQGDQAGSGNALSFLSGPAGLQPYFNGTVSGLSVTELYGYFYEPDINQIGCGGMYTINWGDGTSDTFASGTQWCPYSYGDGYPEVGYGTPRRSHTYAAAGNYALSISYNDGTHPATVVASATVPLGGSACTDGGINGGWRYNANSSDSDNSVTQWPVLALAEAKNRWNIDVNPKVVDRLNQWLTYSQCTNGAFGYTSGDSSGWCNFPKGAAGTIMLKYSGKALTDTPVQNALTYLTNNWGDGENLGNLYGMYAYFKAMKSWGLTADLSGRDWNHEYTQYLVNHQTSSNYWNDSEWEDSNFATYSALAILAPEVASLPPVANAGGPYANATPLQPIKLDGSKSYHLDSTKHIVTWQWDFDSSDGLWWNTKPAPAAGEGAVGINPSVTYPKIGADKAYTVTLRILDDGNPVMTATDSAIINVTSKNVPPTALTNGPWTTLPGSNVVFDGTKSFDSNSCTTLNDPSCLGDAVVKYEWDLNGDGIFNNPDGSDGTPLIPGDWSKVSKTFATPQNQQVTLRVTDKEGLVGTSAANLNIVSVTLLFAKQYDYCYSITTDRTHLRQGLKIKFQNQGNAQADKVFMTATNLPSGLAFTNKATGAPNNSTNLGSMGPGEVKYSACDPAAHTADIEVIVNRSVNPTGTWSWRAAFELNGTPYQIDNIAPIN